MKKKIYMFLILACIMLFTIIKINFRSVENNDDHYFDQWALANDGTFEFSRLDDTYIYIHIPIIL